MLKDFQVDLELSPKDNRVIQTGATYWSHDVNTAKINIKLLRHSEPVILNKDVTVRVMMLFDDENKSEHIYTAKIEDEKSGIVSVILDKNVRSYVGQVICGVYADYGAEQKTDNGYFTFAMKRSLIDKRMPEMKQYYVSDFEDTLAKMKLANAEFAEVETKLNGRIDVIEKDIASNEVAKQSQVEKLRRDMEEKNLVTENLFTGTRDIDGNKWITLDGWVKDGTYKGFTVKKKTGQWKGLTQDLHAEKDEVYTLSAYVKTDTKNSVTFYALHGENTATNDNTLMGVSDKWSRISINFKASQTGTIRPRFEPKLSNTTMWICGLKLEKGSKALPWAPSFEDLAYQDDINGIQKQIDELKKAITNLGGTL